MNSPRCVATVFDSGRPGVVFSRDLSSICPSFRDVKLRSRAPSVFREWLSPSSMAFESVWADADVVTLCRNDIERYFSG